MLFSCENNSRPRVEGVFGTFNICVILITYTKLLMVVEFVDGKIGTLRHFYHNLA